MASKVRDYYANLLISQYRDVPIDLSDPNSSLKKSKAWKTIQMLTDLVYADDLFLKVEKVLDLGLAEGKWLDHIGNRYDLVRTYIDSNHVTQSLTDAEFKEVIQLSLMGRGLTDSFKELLAVLKENYGNDLTVRDLSQRSEGDGGPIPMTMAYSGKPSLFSRGLTSYINYHDDILPRPTGVSLDPLDVTYRDAVPHYGFRTYKRHNHEVVSMEQYSNYSSGYRSPTIFINYSYIVS